MVAEAESAIDKSKEPGDEFIKKGKALLDKAAQIYPDVKRDPAYLNNILRVTSFDLDTALQIIDMLSSNAKTITAARLSLEFLKKREFESAYQLVVAGFPGIADRTPEERNCIAYFASLANRDLEIALAEVDKALKEEVNSEMLDTKAWVLHRLNKNEEALPIINEAISLQETELKKLPADVLKTVERFLDGKLDDKKSLRTPVQELLKNLAVLRYHRAEILLAAGKDEDAEKQFEWLDIHFPIREELY